MIFRIKDKKENNVTELWLEERYSNNIYLMASNPDVYGGEPFRILRFAKGTIYGQCSVPEELGFELDKRYDEVVVYDSNGCKEDNNEFVP